MTRFAPLAMGIALLLGGCGDGADDARGDAATDGSATGAAAPLPKPEGAVGSVTGMPANPGPGTSRIEPIDPVAIGAGESDGGSGLEPGVQAAEPQIIHVPAPDAAEIAVAGIPEPPQPPVALVPPAAPDPLLPAPSRGDAPPIGTEGATETTTIVVGADDADDPDD